MKFKIFTTVFLILILAIFLRFYKVTQVPPSLNWDEASIGYNAYSILKTGKDEWGQVLPIHFKSYGEYKLPIQVYFSIPAISIFGLNEFGLRITPVIYGTLTVFTMFFLGRLIFQSNLAGIIASLLLAISPWHIHLTRASFESSFATFWIVLGMWLLLKGFTGRKWFIISMFPFALSVFTYNSARIFTPLFLLVVFLINWKILLRFKREVILSVVTFAILLLPITPYLLSGERSARYKLVSITDDPGLIPRINKNRGDSKLPKPLPRLIHNKVTYVSYYFGRNYLAHFSPQFLFLSGSPHKQHHVQKIGQLYLFQMPFLLLGIAALFYLRHKFKWFLLSWVLLATIPVAVTNDSIPHALRTLIAAPFYQLVSGFGFVLAWRWVNKKTSKFFKLSMILSLTLIVIFSLKSYLQNYYQIYPNLYSRDWQYGYKQVLQFIDEHKDEYDEVVFTRHYGEPHMFTLFYLNYDPAKYQNDPNLVRFETNNWVWVLRFDKYYFPDLGDEGTQFADIVKENPGKKMLFIGRAGDFPKEIPRLSFVNFLNGENAFDIVSVK